MKLLQLSVIVSYAIGIRQQKSQICHRACILSFQLTAVLRSQDHIKRQYTYWTSAKRPQLSEHLHTHKEKKQGISIRNAKLFLYIIKPRKMDKTESNYDTMSNIWYTHCAVHTCVCVIFHTCDLSVFMLYNHIHIYTHIYAYTLSS